MTKIYMRRNNDTMPLQAALMWTRAAAAQLLGSTVIVAGNMVKDDVGYSVSTYSALKNYDHLPDDAPIESHMNAILILKEHAKTQLNKEEWREARDAIADAYAKETGLTPPDEQGKKQKIRVYAHDKSPATMDGGTSHYELRPDGRMRFFFGFRRNKPTAKALIEGAGLVKGNDYRYVVEKDEGGNKVYWIEFHPDRLQDAGVALAPVYPECAEAIAQLGSLWRKLSGLKAPAKELDRGPSAPSAPSRDAEKVIIQGATAPRNRPQTTGNAENGSVDRFQWRWNHEAFRIDVTLPDGMFARGIAEEGGHGAGFAKEGANYRLTIPTSQIAGFAEQISGNPRLRPLAEALAAHALEWGQEKSSLKQSKEAGRAEGGSWRLINEKGVDVLRIYTDYTETQWWKDVAGAKRSQDPTGKWYTRVSIRNILKVIKGLRDYFPRLAEAISRAWGGIAGVVDEEETNRCGLLGSISQAIVDRKGIRGAVCLGDIKSDLALKEVLAVDAELKRVLPQGKALLPFQTIGVAFAKNAGWRALIADSPGLGKTMQALGSAALNPKLFPVLIVSPANVLYHWIEAIEAWLPDVDAVLVDTGRQLLPDPKDFRGAIVCSWDMMRERVGDFKNFGFQCVIADEAHNAKNPTAARTRALKILIKPDEEGGAKIPYALLLTGTPINNDVGELWPLLSMLDPETWGSRKGFVQQFVGEVKTVSVRKEDQDETGKKHVKNVDIQRFEGVKNTKVLQDRLACTMIRRLKDDALKDLPPKTRLYVNVGMNAAQSKEYSQAKRHFEEWLKKTLVDRYAAQGIDPETVTDAIQARIVRSLRAQIIVQMGQLRTLTGRFKSMAAVRMARALAAKGESCLLFCEHREVVHALAEGMKASGIPFGIIDGDTPPKQRKKLKDQFQDQGTLKVLICTRAAKEGLTLTRAAVSILVERYWTPAAEQQAEDRIHRIGQTRMATILILHIAGTIDDYMRNINDKKRDLVEAIYGDEEALEAATEAAQEELIAAVTLARFGVGPGEVLAVLGAAHNVGWFEENYAKIAGSVARVFGDGGDVEEREALTQIMQRLQNPKRAR